MDYDITNLTFLDDPLTYQIQYGDVSAHVPANLSTEEELFDFLSETLPFPPHSVSEWNSLHDVLRYWGDWQTIPHRVILLHRDLPFLHADRLGWLNLQDYLKILLDSIKILQEQNVQEPDQAKHQKLVVIFPTHMSEEIHAVLTHPPTWYATLGFEGNALLATERDPTWSMVLQYLRRLDGLIAEICTLSRQDMGTMTVQYNRRVDSYYVGYEVPDSLTELVASLDGNPSVEEDPSTFRGVSFALLEQILETFFLSGQRLPTVQWSQQPYNTETRRANWDNRTDEEALVNLNGAMKYETLVPGLQEAVFAYGEAAYSVPFWQEILPQTDVPLVIRLAAICVVGLSDLPSAPTLLHPLLHSPVKQERWVSARFCGFWGDEEALPVLLSMLSDELPFPEQQANNFWYEGWRGYAPILLRKWPTPEVNTQLRQAFVLWLQSEPPLDDDYIDIWKAPEANFCYELGYRGDFAALNDLTLEESHRQQLLAHMERGAKAKRLNMTPREEYAYRMHGTVPKR